MKELSIEEKSRRYDETLERAKHYQKVNGSSVITAIFPELKESEDKESKKWILEYLYDGLRKSDEQFKGQFKTAIAWLEKQAEHANFRNNIQVGDRVTRNEAGVLVNISQLNRIAKPRVTNKVEPKFHEGDWVVGRVTNNEPRQIAKIAKKGYKTTYNGWIGFSFEEDVRLWTIQDAKDGDVLYSLDSYQPFIYKERKPFEQATAYCGLNIYGKFFVWNTKDCIITLDKYIPATREQRDQLEKAMTDAGYTFDFDKKELKKIEQKPAWSEEDEETMSSLLSFFLINTSDQWVKYGKWLKSLKQRMGG